MSAISRPSDRATWLANDEMGFGGHLRRCSFAGADGPDRLVRNDDVAGQIRCDTNQSLRRLPQQDFFRLAGFALGQQLADADDRDEFVFERGVQVSG